jgi:hypothetical protein
MNISKKNKNGRIAKLRLETKTWRSSSLFCKRDECP